MWNDYVVHSLTHEMHFYFLVVVLHLIILPEITEHYDGPTLHLPHHPPQVIHCVLQRALCHHECLGLSVSLTNNVTNVTCHIHTVIFVSKLIVDSI